MSMKQMTLDPYYEKLVEDEFYSAIENRDRKIEENNRIIEERDKILALQDALIAQMNKKQSLSSVIKQKLDEGCDAKLIMKAINWTKYKD